MQDDMLHIKRKYQKPQLEDLGCGFFIASISVYKV